MMDLLFKTIIGPIVEVSLGSFLAYDIDLLFNTSVLCHKSLELSRNLKITFR